MDEGGPVTAEPFRGAALRQPFKVPAHPLPETRVTEHFRRLRETHTWRGALGAQRGEVAEVTPLPACRARLGREAAFCFPIAALLLCSVGVLSANDVSGGRVCLADCTVRQKNSSSSRDAVRVAEPGWVHAALLRRDQANVSNEQHPVA